MMNGAFYSSFIVHHLSFLCTVFGFPLGIDIFSRLSITRSMQRLLLFTLIALVFSSPSSKAQSIDCAYPMIFLHGWTGNQNSFSSVYNNPSFVATFGPLSDQFHAVVNATTATNIWGSDGQPEPRMTMYWSSLSMKPMISRRDASMRSILKTSGMRIPIIRSSSKIVGIRPTYLNRIVMKQPF